MDPIDKFLLRLLILILGSIFGWSSVKTTGAIEDLANTSRSSHQQHSINAGLINLPPKGGEKNK